MFMDALQGLAACHCPSLGEKLVLALPANSHTLMYRAGQDTGQELSNWKWEFCEKECAGQTFPSVLRRCGDNLSASIWIGMLNIDPRYIVHTLLQFWL